MTGEEMTTRREFDAEKFATRREFDQLLVRVDSMDQGGTRGVVAIQVQITDMVKDMTELKLDMGHRFEAVDIKFEDQRQERVSSRRWLVSIGVAGIASMTAVIALLLTILHQV